MKTELSVLFYFIHCAVVTVSGSVMNIFLSRQRAHKYFISSCFIFLFVYVWMCLLCVAARRYVITHVLKHDENRSLVVWTFFFSNFWCCYVVFEGNVNIILAKHWFYIWRIYVRKCHVKNFFDFSIFLLIR